MLFVFFFAGERRGHSEEVSIDGSSDEEVDARLQLVVLPCFGHASAIELNTTQDLVVLDCLLQPFSQLHRYCLHHGDEPQTPRHDPGHEKRAAMVETACILLATFLLRQQSAPVLLAEALCLHLHNGLQVVDKTTSRPMGVAALILQLQAMAASSNGQLHVCLSRQSLAQGLQQTLKGIQTAWATGGKFPSYAIVISQRYANDSLGLEVCVVCASQRQIRLWHEDGFLDTHRPQDAIAKHTALFREVCDDLMMPAAPPLPPANEKTETDEHRPKQASVTKLAWPQELSDEQEQAAHQLCNLAEHKLRLPLSSFNLVDFVVLVGQVCPLYLQTQQCLAASPAVRQLLRSLNADPSLATDVARERVVICLSDAPDMLSLQLRKLLAYIEECSKTLFVVVFDDCLPPSQPGSEVHGALDTLFEMSNVLPLSVTAGAFSWPAISSAVPAENCIHLVPAEPDDALWRDAEYFGLEQLAELASSGQLADLPKKGGWQVDEEFEREVQLCLAHPR